MNRVELCAVLRVRRLERRIKQKALARELHIRNNYLSELELGHHTPSYDLLDRWAQSLGYRFALIERAP